MGGRRAGTRAHRERELFQLKVGREVLVVLSVSTRARRAGRDGLSPTERAVALDAASGLSNQAIARKRRRSPRTIANQIASVYRKLGVSSRAELVAYLHASQDR